MFIYWKDAFTATGAGLSAQEKTERVIYRTRNGE
jgi:hypothetical protein